LKKKAPAIQKLRIEYLDLERLKRWPRNPKTHDVELIDKSFERFGYKMPIAIDERTQRLCAGHGRIDALSKRKSEGREPPDGIFVKVKSKENRWLVPVVRGMYFRNNAEVEAYLVADNQPVIMGGWSEPQLAEILGDLLKNSSLEGTGFDESEVAAMIAKLDSNEEPPADFRSVDASLPTEYKCPSCAYEWSGNPKPGSK
jgi:hypothetical protein